MTLTNYQRNEVKTTMRYYLTPVRMAIINKSTHNKCRWGIGERGTFLQGWWECRLVRPLWKAVWKWKMDLPFDPVISILEIYLKEPKTLIIKNISTPMFNAALFTISKIWKQPKCPSVDEWIEQLWDIYTMECYSTVKKKKVLPFATVWMDMENILLSEISQAEKDKYHTISLMCEI